MSEPRSEAGSITVSLSALQYEGQEGYLLFRRDTAVFITGNQGATFVHGGNSLQERVIPVLNISHRHASETVKLKYLVEVKAEKELLGFSRLQLRVKPASGVQLTFIGARTIGLSLRVADRPDIQLIIKDAPGIEIKNQVLQVPVESDWSEVLFALKGQQGERVLIEVYHPEGVEDVEPSLTVELFNVSGTLQTTQELSEAAAPSKNTTEWHDGVPVAFGPKATGTPTWWTFAGGSVNNTLKYGLQYQHDWKIVADNFKLKIVGDSLGQSTLHIAIEKIQSEAFWVDPLTQNFIWFQLPQYRLSKFQKVLPEAYSLEMISEYLLNIRRTFQFLQSIRLDNLL